MCTGSLIGTVKESTTVTVIVSSGGISGVGVGDAEGDAVSAGIETREVSVADISDIGVLQEDRVIPAAAIMPAHQNLRKPSFAL